MIFESRHRPTSNRFALNGFLSEIRGIRVEKRAQNGRQPSCGSCGQDDLPCHIPVFHASKAIKTIVLLGEA
jgi:hypothetical protein